MGEDGKMHTPVLLHRAVTGTTERFMAVVIEHYGGAFPMWLSPVQAVVIPVADRHLDYAREVQERLVEKGLRVEVDGTQGGHRWAYAIGDDWTIRPNLLNEFRIRYQSATADFLRGKDIVRMTVTCADGRPSHTVTRIKNTPPPPPGADGHRPRG